MGVPVLSRCGDAHVSRVGASLLARVGLTDWVADGEDDYVEKAVCHAMDLSLLTRIRAELRDRMRESPLCDAHGFTRDLEAAYRVMWRAWCER